MKTISTLFVYFLLIGISCAQWTVQNLGFARNATGSASNDEIVLIAGGNLINSSPLDNVEIFDLNTLSWEVEHLTYARATPAVCELDNKFYVAGGIHQGTGVESDAIEIYDRNTRTWETETLSSPKVYLSAVAYNGKVIFAGGGTVDGSIYTATDEVQIYDVESKTWTQEKLSVPRMAMGAIVAEGKAYFAGGVINLQTPSDVIDIYDFETGNWSTSNLSSARGFLTANELAGRVYFAGGIEAKGMSSEAIDVYDIQQGIWYLGILSRPRGLLSSAVACDRIYFIGGGSLNPTSEWLTASYNEIDIYDSVTDSWSVDEMPLRRADFSAEGQGNILVVAGGFQSGASNPLINTAYWQMCEPNVGTNNLKLEGLEIFPNPGEHTFSIKFDNFGQGYDLYVHDLLGKCVYHQKLLTQTQNTTLQIPKVLSDGIYFLTIRDINGKTSKAYKLVKN